MVTRSAARAAREKATNVVPDKPADEETGRVTGMVTRSAARAAREKTIKDRPDKSADESSTASSITKKKKKKISIQKERNDIVDKEDPEYSMLESLQWKTESAFERIFSELRSDEKSSDLLSLSKVSPIFHKEVHKFMKKDCNRPGIDEVRLKKTRDGLEVSILLYRSNLPFYDLASLDWGRFERSKEFYEPVLLVKLAGSDDPIIEQLTALLSSSIDGLTLGDNGRDGRPLTSSDLSLCEQFLSGSTSINTIAAKSIVLDGTTAVLLNSISRDTEDYSITLRVREQFGDPVAFIEKFGSLSYGHVFLEDLTIPRPRPPYLFFALCGAFWERFFNEMLSNGSIQWIQTANRRGMMITRAPIDWPETPIGGCLEWLTVMKK